MIWRENNALCRRFDKELLRIEPWGTDSLRVRATQNNRFAEEGTEEQPLLARPVGALALTR